MLKFYLTPLALESWLGDKRPFTEKLLEGKRILKGEESWSSEYIF